MTTTIEREGYAMSTLTTVPRSAAEAAELYPEFQRGTAVAVHPSWSFGQPIRMVGCVGTIVGPVRNGYFRVREGDSGCTCDYLPRDLSLAP